jgi:hypothetical protein
VFDLSTAPAGNPFQIRGRSPTSYRDCRSATVQPTAGEVVQAAFLRDLVSLQNRTRGALFEVIGENLIESHLRRLDLDPGVARQHVCVATPWGRRFIDLWFDEHRTLVEVK